MIQLNQKSIANIIFKPFKLKRNSKEKNKSEINVEKFLKQFNSNSQSIIDCYKEWKRIEETLDRKHEVTYNAFLWQTELVVQYSFFGNILGYIDSQLDDLYNSLEFDKHFLNEQGTSEAYEKDLKKIAELTTKREQIVSDYKEIVSKNSLEIIDKAVSSTPSYTQFTEVFENSKTNRLGLLVQNEFLKAYNDGYLIVKDNLFSDIFFEEYDKNISLIKENKHQRIKIKKD